jgi:hypothetical protein
MCEKRQTVDTEVVAIAGGKGQASVRFYDDGRARVRFTRHGMECTTPLFSPADWKAIADKVQTMELEALVALPDAIPAEVAV